jgi:hypothetical protein
MRKNTWFVTGMLAVALISGMVLLGCPNDPPEEDTWSDVTSLDQLNGTWKGSYSESMTIKEFWGEEWDDSMTTQLGDIKMTISEEVTFTFNAAVKTQTTSEKTTVVFSGGKINEAEAWAAIKSFFEGEGGEVNDNNHSMTGGGEPYEEQLYDKDIADILGSGLQINQNGTKIKIPASSMIKSSPELIMIKQ